MIFAGDLAAKVLAGEKTVTRRLWSENPRSPWHDGPAVGRTYAVQDGRGHPAIGHVEIVSAQTELMRHDGRTGDVLLDDAEARREGFASSDEFAERWRALHGKYVGDEPLLVWRIEFKLA